MLVLRLTGWSVRPCSGLEGMRVTEQCHGEQITEGCKDNRGDTWHRTGNRSAELTTTSRMKGLIMMILSDC